MDRDANQRGVGFGEKGRRVLLCAAWAGLAGFLAAAAAACGDGNETSSPSGSSSSSSSSSGGGGAGGGSAAGCMESSAFADAFSIAAGSDLCAVAIYDAAIDPATFSVPTWGRHGGPLTVLQGAAAGTVAISRWQVPAEPVGSLSAQPQTLNASLPVDAYLGAQALDLPFFAWTAISWTPPFPAIGGEIVLLAGDQVAQSYKANSPYALSALGGASAGRLLYSGLSVLGDAAGMSNGLYAADTCGGTAMQDARLLPEGDGTCGAPLGVAAWGEASGPVAADSAGNVFAVMSNFSTKDQELRGFEASVMARGQPASEGQMLSKLSGYGSALAALAPSGAKPGLLLFQPSDTSAGPKNIMGMAYTVTASKVELGSTENDLLVPAQPATAFTLMNDSQDRLWVGVPTGKTTRFIVLSRPAAP